MASNAATNERVRIGRMLRNLKAGDRVRATRSSTEETGTLGTVLDPEPVSSDGIRRVKVRWDSLRTHPINCLPTSIEEIE